MGNSNSTTITDVSNIPTGDRPPLPYEPDYTAGLKDTNFDLKKSDNDELVYKIKTLNAINCARQHHALMLDNNEENYANYVICAAHVVCPDAREVLERDPDRDINDILEKEDAVRNCIMEFAKRDREIGEKGSTHLKKYIGIVMKEKVPDAGLTEVMSRADDKAAEKLLQDMDKMKSHEYMKGVSPLLAKFCNDEWSNFENCIARVRSVAKDEKEATERAETTCAVEHLKAAYCTEAVCCSSKIRECMKRIEPLNKHLSQRQLAEACFDETNVTSCISSVMRKLGAD
eukprot:GEZU01028088.1.p1 GENE.GEZU01028088.1~~GEZU01028088.1.p1  ORF type:complete len:287 (-),score=90.35 GEZU01028088.1:13-873(-)